MKKFWKPLEWMTPELELVRGLILEHIKTIRLPSAELEAAALGLFDPPGKMIRSGLVLLCARSFGPWSGESLGLPWAGYSAAEFGRHIRNAMKRPLDMEHEAEQLAKPPVKGALPLKFYLLAAAVEVLHTATLLHDDVLDNADTRRSRQTVKSLLGNRMAILLGDHLLTMAFSMVSEAASINSARIISRVTAGICRGEMLQNSLLFSLERGASERLYKQRIAGKTAAMFSLSMYVGTREALYFGSSDDDDPRNDPPLCRYMRRYGYATGMAFQIIDDVLDMDIRTDNGKTRGSDLREGILTLPIIRLLESGRLAPGDVSALWETPGSIGGFLAEDRCAWACERGLEEAGRYMSRAEDALHEAENLLGKPAKDLRTLSKLLLDRKL